MNIITEDGRFIASEGCAEIAAALLTGYHIERGIENRGYIVIFDINDCLDENRLYRHCELEVSELWVSYISDILQQHGFSPIKSKLVIIPPGEGEISESGNLHLNIKSDIVAIQPLLHAVIRAFRNGTEQSLVLLKCAAELFSDHKEALYNPQITGIEVFLQYYVDPKIVRFLIRKYIPPKMAGTFTHITFNSMVAWAHGLDLEKVFKYITGSNLSDIFLALQQSMHYENNPISYNEVLEGIRGHSLLLVGGYTVSKQGSLRSDLNRVFPMFTSFPDLDILVLVSPTIMRHIKYQYFNGDENE